MRLTPDEIKLFAELEMLARDLVDASIVARQYPEQARTMIHVIADRVHSFNLRFSYMLNEEGQTQ